MKIKFAQIRGDEILHLSYNQRAEEIERLNKHVDDQAATIAQLQAIATAAREYFHKTKGLADFAHIEYEDLEAALAALEQETK